MLSRVADCIFWMSRYLERAENVARFIEVNLNLTLELGATAGEQWAPLVYTTGDHAAFLGRYGAATQHNVISFLAFDEQNPNSILACLQAARENARCVRECISSSMWEEINQFYLTVRNTARSSKSSEAQYDFFNGIKRSSQLIHGATDTTMSYGEPWHFARLGRLLERADKTSRILDVKYFILLPRADDVGTPLDTVQWSALLRSASALEMYRQAKGRIAPELVADFLVLDRLFPRSMHSCLIGAEESLRAITGSRNGTFGNRAEQLLGQLRAELDYADIKEIVRHGLHEFIDRFQSKLNGVGHAVGECFFNSTSNDVCKTTNGHLTAL